MRSRATLEWLMVQAPFDDVIKEGYLFFKEMSQTFMFISFIHAFPRLNKLISRKDRLSLRPRCG
jgi:hypothetical protein